MIDNRNVISNAFKYLQSYETILEISKEEKRKLNIPENIIAWKILTEVLEKLGEVIEIELHLIFLMDFPLSIPQIYVAPADYELIKYIPHLDSNRLICTFDTETSRPDPLNPNGIIIDCLKRAKAIISDGLAEVNFNDFDDEFIAYWECIYGKNDSLLRNLLCLINGTPTVSDIKLIYLEEPIASYKYIIHQEDENSIRFINFLKEQKHKFETIKAFYIGDLFLNGPPYSLKNKDIWNIASGMTQNKDDFIKFINDESRNKFVLGNVKKGNSEHLIGWFHRKFETSRNGFRPKSIKNIDVIKTFQSSDQVIRVSPEIFTNERLTLRTNGQLNSNQKKFTVAGVGSIGSNLVYFLNTFNSPEFLLIDPDILKIENINRHFLGFIDVGKNKANALSNYLQSQNPLQKISVKTESIISVCQKEIDIINDSDYIFVLTGKTNIDTWLFNALEEGLIKKPMFILWVEPYLAGGHCLYINPNSNTYCKVFDNENFFIYNIIKKSEYSNPEKTLILREAGCQSSFSPYSTNDVISFLSTLFQSISSIIIQDEHIDRAFTYIGNLERIKDLNIEISGIEKGFSSGTIIEHDINGI